MGSPDLQSALIFKVNQLGDNIVFLPVVQRMIAEGTFRQLTLWTTPVAAPLFSNLLPRLQLEVVSREQFYPAWKKPNRLFSLTQKVRRSHPSLTLVAEDMGNTAYFLALSSGASRRIGIRPPYLKIPFAINSEIILEPNAPAAEKAWILGGALAEAGGSAPWTQPPSPPDLSHLFHDHADSFDILIHAGASRDYKRWPLSRYIELATRLSDDLRVGWIDDPALGPEKPEAKVKIIRTQNLQDLVSHLTRASVLVANNSGPMNIASALGTPSVILVGPSCRSWDPYWHLERFRILRHESLPCIACDPPGSPILEVCTNHAHPMACMNYWSIERVEAEVRSWHLRWKNTRIEL